MHVSAGIRRPIKRGLAAGAELSRLNTVLLASQRRIQPHYIRAVNYHDVPPGCAEAFERQLQYYRKHFASVGVHDLRAALAGEWASERPGILLTFDDGLRSHAEVVAPLLERYGFTGWFMIPSGFLDAPADAQAAFAREHHILYDENGFPDARVALTWEQARDLADRHEVGCHTRSHQRLTARVSADELDNEIVTARREIEDRLDREVSTFCWVGGEEWSYSAAAADRVRAAGYTFSFMTNSYPVVAGSNPLQLQRTNIEATFSSGLVGLSLSGVYDLLYARKRRRVNRVTGTVDSTHRH